MCVFVTVCIYLCVYLCVHVFCVCLYVCLSLQVWVSGDSFQELIHKTEVIRFVLCFYTLSHLRAQIWLNMRKSWDF